MVDLLLGGRRLLFDSALSREEITRRLQREVAPVEWRLYENRTQLFEGTYDSDGFQMMRLVRGRNSFRPMLEGRILPTALGTRLDVRLRLHPVVVAFCALLGMVGAVVATLTVVDLATASSSAPPWPFLVILMLVFSGFVAATLVEANTATRMLRDLFEAEPSAPGSLSTNNAPHSFG